MTGTFFPETLATPAASVTPAAVADVSARQRWLALLARAEEKELAALLAQVSALPEFRYLRPAETGLCLLRAQTGGSGDPFHLGEVTLTRCTVQLADHTLGVAYRLGRAPGCAAQAALVDALLQTGLLQEADLRAIAVRLDQARTARAAEVEGTRVEFFTLVRGDD